MTSILIISTLAILVIAFMTLLALEKKRNKHIREITKPCKEYTRELRKMNELLIEVCCENCKYDCDWCEFDPDHELNFEPKDELLSLVGKESKKEFRRNKDGKILYCIKG